MDTLANDIARCPGAGQALCDTCRRKQDRSDAPAWYLMAPWHERTRSCSKYIETTDEPTGEA